MDLSLLGAIQMVVAIALPCKISSGTCSRFTPHGGACAAILADGSVVTWGDPDRGGDSCCRARSAQERGGDQKMVVTARSGFMPQVEHLLLSWQMDLSLLGAIQMMVAIALPCKISSGMCSRFMPHISHLLLSWQMDLSLLGATHMMVAIALPCKISSGMCSRFTPQV